MSRVLFPDAILLNENYLVCLTNKHNEEVIIQSESSADRAEYSVQVLNEHEANNARRESYYWRAKQKGEILFPKGKVIP